MKMELLRVRFDEQVRTEKRKTASPAVESQVTGQLKPWREVVTPHKDVASGKYQQAEFAADLWQVHLGEGTDEYRHPAEFFRRTYLTESLKQLLVGAVRRLTGAGGDPVVQLQTNFGGGKTHSMLALYHLFAGGKPGDLLGIDAVLKEAEVANLPKVKRVVLVGNKISPGNPVTERRRHCCPDALGRARLATGLCGGRSERSAFNRIRADDEKATNPGDGCVNCSMNTDRVSSSSMNGWRTPGSCTTRASCRRGVSRPNSLLLRRSPSRRGSRSSVCWSSVCRRLIPPARLTPRRTILKSAGSAGGKL